MTSTATHTPSRDPGLKRLGTGARWAVFTGLAASAVLLASIYAGSGEAATAPSLGTAQSFAVLAGAGITNTGPTTITGDVGSFPTTTQTGFASVTLNGANHAGDAVTQGAKTDLVTAYNNAAGQTPVSTVPTELGGTTLIPGVYDSTAGTFGITGTVTLNAQGDPNAVFIFKMASTLITASASSVNLIGSAQACNVFWQVGSSATLGTNSTFRGNILALTSITLTTGASVTGRVLARNGAVTLDTNTIAATSCALLPTSSPTSTATATTTSVPTVTGSTATPQVPGATRPPLGPGFGAALAGAGGTGDNLARQAQAQAAAQQAAAAAADKAQQAAQPSSGLVRPPSTGDAGLVTQESGW